MDPAKVLSLYMSTLTQPHIIDWHHGHRRNVQLADIPLRSSWGYGDASSNGHPLYIYRICIYTHTNTPHTHIHYNRLSMDLLYGIVFILKIYYTPHRGSLSFRCVFGSVISFLCVVFSFRYAILLWRRCPDNVTQISVCVFCYELGFPPTPPNYGIQCH